MSPHLRPRSRLPLSELSHVRRGWWLTYRWLVLRRISQFGILGLFLLGPWAELWIIKGNLSSSLFLGQIPMSDPFVLLQVLASGHWPGLTAWIGLGVILILYLITGGRSYCAWVCPVNPMTDLAAWLRRRVPLFGRLRIHLSPPRSTRLWLLAGIILTTALAGQVLWESVNPVSTLHRALIFGGSSAFFLVGAVFLYDLFLARQGWCGHLCPMGACYQLIDHASLLRISAKSRDSCNDCQDCFAVCPEPHVITPALKGQGSPLILSHDCTHCGRCIDVCRPGVFSFTTRITPTGRATSSQGGIPHENAQ